MTQIAAAELGLKIEEVEFNYGSSAMPFAPIQGGSFTTATIGSAVKVACDELKKKIFKAAKKLPESSFSNVKFDEVTFENGFVLLKNNKDIKFSLKEIAEASEKPIKTKNSSMPNPLTYGKKARAVHSAVFVEVEVDEELGVIEIKRALTAVAAGQIINPKTAESQVLGGMIWGISKVLHEETILDHQFGKYMNKNLAEYHIPVHADIHDLQVLFVHEEDKFVNDLGIKGVGEIGGVGMPPAITNAVFHATGKRIYNLPIHFDELI
jgi:xanthine dehydrogenase YagR molybdenum-binding subunit